VLVVVLALVAAGAVSGWFAARSSGGVTGLCASATAGLKERNLPKIGIRDATIVLTNFRFGRIDDFLRTRRWKAMAGRGHHHRREQRRPGFHSALKARASSHPRRLQGL
jgi:hypothetical protein